MTQPIVLYRTEWPDQEPSGPGVNWGTECPMRSASRSTTTVFKALPEAEFDERYDRGWADCIAANVDRFQKGVNAVLPSGLHVQPTPVVLYGVFNERGGCWPMPSKAEAERIAALWTLDYGMRFVADGLVRKPQ